MPRRPAKAEKVDQRILERMNIDVDLSPSEVKNYFTSNIFERAFSYLVGKVRSNEYTLIKATPDGKLYVVVSGGGYSDYTPHKGTASDSYTASNTFEEEFTHLTILIKDNSADVSFKDKNGVWKGDIEVTPGWHTFDFAGTGIRIKNHTAGANATYQIITWR